jgi:iron complex outermembrane receptor protein
MAQFKQASLVSLLALSCAMPALAQTPAAAQESAEAAAARAGQDGERDVVVITANKREETVQDVAVAVTAVTAELRDELGINTITDLTNLTPGLSYTSANERVTLRGIGRNTNNFGAEPGVANYTDGIYQSFASIAGRDNIFIDRIEVLRGPQGTLYGRNSVGGALNIISKRPTEDLQAEVRLAAGNYKQRKFAASVSGTIIPDWLRGRVVAYKEVRDEGFYYNHGTQDTEGYNLNNWNAEIQFEGDVGDRLSWWTKYTTGRYDVAGPPGGRTGAGSQAPFNVNFNGGGVLPQPTWAYTTTDARMLSYTQSGSFIGNPRLNGASTDINDSYPRMAKLNAYDDFALEVVYETDDFDIKYVGGYIYYNYLLTGDQDGTPIKSITYRASSSAATLLQPSATGAITNTIYPDQTLNYNENRAFFSNELNFISTGSGPLQWITGIYAYQENFRQPIGTYLPNEPLAASAIPVSSFAPFTITGAAIANPDRMLTYTDNQGLNNAYGVFAQFDYEITDTLKTTLGVRYSVDNKQIKETAELNCLLICGVPFANITQSSWSGRAPAAFGTGPQPGVTSATTANPTGIVFDGRTGVSTRYLAEEWSAVTGTAGLEWSPNNDTLVFAKYSRGYKTGAFNASSMAPLPRTEPEFVNSYELGWKQEIPEWNLTANMAAFLYDYRDIQVPLTEVFNQGTAGETSISALRNVPKVETTGFELETSWNPIDDLTLRFTYAYLRPEVVESGVYVNSNVPRNVPTTDPAYVPFQQSVEGNVLPQSPENKIAFSGSYTFNLEDGSTLTPVVSYYWRDGFASDIFNNAAEITPSFDQTDARLLWNNADGNITLIGWVRNAFDQDGFDSVSASYRANPTTVAVAPNPPGCSTASATCYNPSLPVSATNVPGILYQNFTKTQPRTMGVEVQFRF